MEASTVPRRPRRWSRFVSAALIGVAAFIAIRALAPQTIGETARRQLLSRLEDHYRGYTVSLRRGRFDPDVGFVFEDLRIIDPAPSLSQGRPREMIRVERLTVVTDMHPEKLLDKELPFTTRRLVLQGVNANVWLANDGQLSLVKLLPLPEFGPAAPRIELRRAKVRLFNEASRSRPIDAELTEALLLNTAGASGEMSRTIRLHGSTDFANELLVRIDTEQGATNIECAVKQASLSRDLFDRLPKPWAELVRHAKDLQCVCDINMTLHRSESGALNFQSRARVHEGRFSHPSLPQPLTQLRGVLIGDPSGVSVKAAQGMLGDSLVRASGRIDGYRWPCNTELDVSTRGLMLDDRLAASLPRTMQASWDKIQPHGRVDVDAKLQHRNAGWVTDATVICKGLDVRYDNFPYPVENLVGRVEIRDGVASTESLDGRVGESRMQCAFRSPIRPGISNEKSFVIGTDGPIPLDKTLLAALTPRGSPTTKLESFVRSLRPRGSVQLASATLTTDANGQKSRKIDLRVMDGHLRYQGFAYPLDNVAGKIEIEDEWVKLIGLRATNANGGIVLCDGTYRIPVKQPSGRAFRISDMATLNQSASELSLNFRATDVPMDDSLRRSLPESTVQAWDAVSPSGILDELDVVVSQHGSDAPLGLNVTAKQHERGPVTNRSLSLRPTALPYRLDVTSGTVRFDGSKVTIHSLKARHDASTLAADGHCIRGDSGRWELMLQLHSGSRLHPDAEFIDSLPNQMREAMRRLQLRGPVSMRGQTRALLPDATHPNPAFEWDLVLQLEGNRIADVGPVHSIRGEISVQGVQDRAGPRAVGEVRIDSMHVHDLQLTGIRGPFSIDGDLLLLGSQPSNRNSNDDTASRPTSIRGNLFDGIVDLDGQCGLSSGRFDVRLSVRDAQVPTLLADFGHANNQLTGTFSGQAQLQGDLGTTDLLKGSGSARLSGANLYQLPLIVQILYLLRVTPTEDVAFTDGRLDFTIDGETMTFSDLRIWGELVALHGGGTLDRRRELNLTFNTRVSPQNTFTQALRPLGNGRYTLWTIDVHGPLNALEFDRRAFEGVAETLERLFPVMAERDIGTPAESIRRFRSWFREP